MSDGRGGQKAKRIDTRIPSGWVAEKKADTAELPITRKQLSKSIGKRVEEQVWEKAKEIYLLYLKRMEIFENPLTTTDHKQKGRSIWHFRKTLLNLVKSAAEKLENDLSNELSHDLASLVLEQLKGPEKFTGSQKSYPNPNAGKSPSLRRHMDEASFLLREIEHILENVNLAGEAPLWSQAEIRNNAGLELKNLARDYKLPLRKFVLAFGIHTGNSEEADIQWFKRLK